MEDLRKGDEWRGRGIFGGMDGEGGRDAGNGVMVTFLVCRSMSFVLCFASLCRAPVYVDGMIFFTKRLLYILLWALVYSTLT